MQGNRGLKVAAGLMVAGALVIAAAGPGLSARAAAAGSGGMGGMMGMMGGDAGHSMMGMMDSTMMQAMDSPEFKDMVRACQAFMNSPAMQRMMESMGEAH